MKMRLHYSLSPLSAFRSRFVSVPLTLALSPPPTRSVFVHALKYLSITSGNVIPAITGRSMSVLGLHN